MYNHQGEPVFLLQVYKAKVRSSGRWVAVKVQRPGVRESIALDVYIIRYLAGQIGRLRKLNSDLPSLLDEWAESLFRELDYRREAQNGTLFRQLYSHLEVSILPNGFCLPRSRCIMRLSDFDLMQGR